MPPTSPTLANLFTGLPDSVQPEEWLDVLAASASVRVERIVSTGQSTPPGAWLDQDDHEWVVLLAGSATLRLDTPRRDIAMQPGDHLHLPAHTRHRVEQTSTDPPAVWLAVHYAPDAG